MFNKYGKTTENEIKRSDYKNGKANFANKQLIISINCKYVIVRMRIHFELKNWKNLFFNLSKLCNRQALAAKSNHSTYWSHST